MLIAFKSTTSVSLFYLNVDTIGCNPVNNITFFGTWQFLNSYWRINVGQYRKIVLGNLLFIMVQNWVVSWCQHKNNSAAISLLILAQFLQAAAFNLILLLSKDEIKHMHHHILELLTLPYLILVINQHLSFFLYPHIWL